MPSRRACSGNYAVYRSFSNKLAEAALLPVYLARCRRKVDASDADADGDNEEGEVLESDANVENHDGVVFSRPSCMPRYPDIQNAYSRYLGI
jgi:hypothetical protein